MHFLGSNATEVRWRPGLHPGLCWGSLQGSPRPLRWISGGCFAAERERKEGNGLGREGDKEGGKGEGEGGKGRRRKGEDEEKGGGGECNVAQ